MSIPGDIDQQVSQQAIDQPGLGNFTFWHLLEGDFKFVKRVVTGLIDPWCLTGRADKHSGKEVGESGVVLPIGNQAAQQIGPPQHRTVGRRFSAQGDVVATTGACVTTVLHELFRAETTLSGFFVEPGGILNQLRPAFGWMDIDFDDTGVGCDGQAFQPVIAGWLVAFNDHWHFELCSRFFNRGNQMEILLQGAQRWHEDM